MKRVLISLLLAACGDNIHPAVANPPVPPDKTPDWCPVPPVSDGYPDAGMPDAPPVSTPPDAPDPDKCSRKLEHCQDWCEWKYDQCEEHENDHGNDDHESDKR